MKQPELSTSYAFGRLTTLSALDMTHSRDAFRVHDSERKLSYSRVTLLHLSCCWLIWKEERAQHFNPYGREMDGFHLQCKFAHLIIDFSPANRYTDTLLAKWKWATLWAPTCLFQRAVQLITKQWWLHLTLISANQWLILTFYSLLSILLNS